MAAAPLLARLRARLALPPRAIALIGAVYAASQLAILWTLGSIGAELGRLQVTGFDAATYRDTFQRWIDAGAMDAYRAHFTFDGVHPLWYAALGTVLLCRLFETRGVSHRYDWLLALPLASAFFDFVENAIQQRFLAAPDLAAITDPWPLVSTLASIAKWALIAIWMSVAIALGRRPPGPTAGGEAKGERRR
jgi:hypothetical protein